MMNEISRIEMKKRGSLPAPSLSIQANAAWTTEASAEPTPTPLNTD